MIGRSLMLALCGTLVCAGVAFAGDNNTLYLTQTSDGPLGNSFYADQSHSVGNSITASQSGNGNVAHITTSDLCSSGLSAPCGGTVNLTQDNSSNQTGDAFTVDGQLARNYVSVTTSGNSSATVSQLGDGNSATLNILDGSGNINQHGNDNTASLTVEDGTVGTITQNNDNNNAALTVTGVPGAAASLTQNGGNNYGPATVSTPYAVNTPYAGLPVTITQY